MDAMRSNNQKPRGKPELRGELRPAGAVRQRALPSQASLHQGDNGLPVNGHLPLAHPAREIVSASRRRLFAETPVGDCFVVVNCGGECWDGERWVKGWWEAVQFRRPEPAYELCERAAREATGITGVDGLVCYIPPGTPSIALAPFPDLSQVDLRDFARKPEVC